MPESPDSDSCWKLMRNWLEQCTQDHTTCINSPITTRELIPKHLLRIGKEQHPIIRLVGNEEVPVNCLYSTLSRRWSSEHLPKLTQRTHPDLKVGIKSTNLPRLLQDVITVAQNLQIEYLWIDSLCIFQDSLDDLNEQAAEMGKIYGNCYCNIAATAASHGKEGLFTSRPAAKGSTYPVQVQFMLNGKEPLATYFCADIDLWKRNVDDSILNRRGWVLQERQLAPRVIHFAREQIFWECRQASASETFPSGEPDVATIMPDGPQFRPPREMIRALIRLCEVKYSGETGIRRLAEGEDVAAANGVYLAWARLVERYSNCQLTKEEDKLIAISGIAKLLQDLLEDEYLAGLWRKQLHYHLMWYLETSQRENNVALTKPRHWRAPTWSWASIDGRSCLFYWNLEEKAGFYDSEVVKLIEIIEAKTFCQTGDPTGQVLGGYVKIKGSLSKAKSFVSLCPGDVKMGSIHLKDCRYESTLAILDDPECAPGDEEEGMEVVLMPMQMYDNNTSDTDGNHFSGLILSPCDDLEQIAVHGAKTFIRVGLFELSGIMEDHLPKHIEIYDDGNPITLV